MDNPGIRNLGDVALAAINAATTAAVVTSQTDAGGDTQAYVDRLQGMLAASISVNFNYGSGGTSIKVLIETSLDQGTTWTEVWRCALGTASEQNIINLSGLTPLTTPYTPAALTDDTTKDGIFGDRLRARILTVGTYAGNTSLAIRMHAR
jgi:hypothetical protein